MAFRQWIAVSACLAGMTVLPAAQEGAAPFTPGDIGTHCAVTGTCTSPDDTSMFEIDTRKPIAGARWDHVLMVFDANGTLVESMTMPIP